MYLTSTYMYHKNTTIHVGKYTSPMNSMGFEKVCFCSLLWDQFVLQESIEKATRQLARLRMVDEVNKMLDPLGW